MNAVIGIVFGKLTNCGQVYVDEKVSNGFDTFCKTLKRDANWRELERKVFC